MSAVSRTKKAGKEFWYIFSKNKIAVAGLVLVSISIVIALFSPWIAPYDPFQTRTGDRFESPSQDHIFGTDDLGRDVFSGVIHGSRVSLLVGFMSALFSASFGVFVGAIAAFRRGIIGDLFTRMIEVFQVLPAMFLALIFVSFFGRNIWYLILVLSLTIWPQTARICRAEVLSIKERPYVKAAQAIGGGDLYIMFSEILPNALPPVVANATLQIGRAILLEAGLSFLGLGDPNIMSWGVMLRNSQYFIRQAWWMMVFPGMAISIVTLGMNLMGDGLVRTLSPHKRLR